VKELFPPVPPEALLRTEVAFAEQAAASGVRLPANRPDREGRYLLTAPDGSRLRVYDWVDLNRVDPAAGGTAAALGTLLARLHRAGAVASTEPDGSPPDPWYHSVPSVADFATAARSGATWAARLAQRLDTLDELCADVQPADPDRLRLCHRDLHPENVLADPEGALVVVDWDGFGPAAPERELAMVALDWFGAGPSVDLAAVGRLVEGYSEAGGPGRLTELADFSMLLGQRLNFLLSQLRVALDPDAESRHRAWAEWEIDEGLTILPTPAQLRQVLAAVGAARPPAPGLDG
jgi:Ser/Thr protein kinase RdoA (MazF antagonist)